MKRVLSLTALGIVAATTMIRPTPSVAQDCGPCASKTSVSSCVACVKVTQPGKWIDAQMSGWCTRNIAMCKKK